MHIVRCMLAGLLLATLLGGCGAIHRLPDISDLDRKKAIEEIDAAGAELAPSERSVTDNAKMVSEVSARLRAAVEPVCAHAGHESCTFDVVFRDKDTFNAYATGTNRIIMFDGFVRVLESEDECAAVLAHEMGHHIAGHIEKTRTNAAIGSAISMVLVTALQVAVGAYGGPSSYSDTQRTLQDAQKLGEGIGALSFSKEHEREADYIAAYILKRAGYDLVAARKVWMRLTRASGKTESDLFSTHPAGPERLAAWDKAVAEVEASADLLPVLVR
ncbi:MAG: M48 family metallopeptidase [Alphaproteobacteria bacterium]